MRNSTSLASDRLLNPKIKGHFRKVSAAALGVVTQVYIKRELKIQLRKRVQKKDIRRLTKLRVISGADIEKLRAAKEEEAKKPKYGKGKQFSNKQSSTYQYPHGYTRTSTIARKQVRIASESIEPGQHQMNQKVIIL